MVLEAVSRRAWLDFVRKPRTIRTHLALLLSACIAPIIAFSCIALVHMWDAEWDSYDKQIMGTAHALASAVDLKLENAVAALSALAAAPAIDDGDLDKLYRQSAEVAAQHNASIIIADGHGVAVFATSPKLQGLVGHKLVALPAYDALRSGKAQVSDLYIGRVSGQPRARIYVPVVRAGAVRYLLTMSFTAEDISHVLVEQNLPDTWIAAIIDRNGVILGRNRELGRFAGEQVTEALKRRMAGGRAAVFRAANQEGMLMLTALARSPYSGWSIALEVPFVELYSPLMRSLTGIGLISLAMVSAGFLLAVMIGWRMARSLGELSAAVRAIGQSTPLTQMQRSAVKEVNDIIAAQRSAARILNARMKARDEAESALRESEQRFRDIAGTSGDWIWEIDAEFRFTEVVGQDKAKTNLDHDRVLGRTRWEVAGADPECDPVWRQHRADLEARRPFRQLRFCVQGRDGETRYVSVSGTPVFGPDSEFKGYRGTGTDETEIVKARARAETAEALLKDAVDSISEGFVIFGPDDRLVARNEAYRKAYDGDAETFVPGKSFEELLRHGLRQGNYLDAIGREEEWLAERMRQHCEAAMTVEQKLKGGRWILATERRMRNGGIAGLRIDITALKEAQSALAEGEARLERAQRIARIGSWELDVRTGQFLWSKEMYRIRGLSPDTYAPHTTTIDQYVHPEDLSVAKAWLAAWRRGDHPPGIELRIRWPNGDIRHVSSEGSPILDSSGTVIKIAGTMRDVTEMREAEQRRRALEDQLHHSQKLEALGTLAGGIAHDLNNTLVPVLAISKLGLKTAAEGSAQREDFELIYAAAQRARDLVKQVLDFSRKETGERKSFRADGVLRDAAAILRRSVPATIDIRTDIRAVPSMHGDPSQIHQIIVNLVTNAVHAIGDRMGTVEVTLAPVTGADEVTPEAVRLTVRDDGCGMDQDMVNRIFEPFFTTKPVGAGTGLGLSVVHGIITSYGGSIRVESEPGKGTLFIVELPLDRAPGHSAAEDKKEERVLA